VNRVKQLDIIIVNYNSTDFLLKCLESIYRDIEEIPVNVFVFDNNSVDNVRRVTWHYPDVRLTISNCNIGFARAVNACIAQGDSPYLLILNPDAVIMDGFFQSVLGYMDKNPQAGVLGPRVYNQDLTVQGSARSFPTPVTSLFGRNSILTRMFPNNRITRKNILHMDIQERTPVKVDWVSGACMMVRRQAVEDVGMLDENFFMYWEDADWCRRMGDKGWDVVYYPEASVIHCVGASSEKNLIKSVVEFHKSVYYFYDKHHQSARWLVKTLILASLGIRIGFVLVVHAVRRWNKSISNSVT
jgi:GT2 family glycosyltransferase